MPGTKITAVAETGLELESQEPVSEEAALQEQDNHEQQQNIESQDATEPIEAQSDSDAIPEKFRGKSVQDVIKSYSGLEKKLGQISSEKSHRDREVDELKSRMSIMEQERQWLVEQARARTSSPDPIEQDPLSSFDESFDSDPKEAIKQVLSRVGDKVAKTREQLAIEMRAKDAVDFYEKQKVENPDFAGLEKDMQSLAQRYAGMIRPEYVNTKETMQLLYDLARGRNVSKYVKEAEDKAKKASEMVRAEKRTAYSESSSASASSASASFEELSLDEMKRRLGVADKD